MLVQDLRFGLRVLTKNLNFTVVAVLTLALGIGASTAIFSLINAALIRSLPYPDPERIVHVWSPNPRFQAPVESLPPMTADFFSLQSLNQSLASFALLTPGHFNVLVEGRADALTGARVTAGFFETMGVSPEIGRTVNAADDQPGQGQVAVISHRLWKTRFGGDGAVLNREVLMDGRPFRIIGVMPTGFAFPNSP